MRLKLSISSAQASSLAEGRCASFHLRGGTIGRGRDNDWVLPDAERVISTHHAIIHYEAGQYFFEDTSSNGSYLNDPGTPIPRGQLVPLHHGDLLYVGDYEIQVELADDAFGACPPPDMPASPPPSEFVARPYVPNSSIPSQSDNSWNHLDLGANQSPVPSSFKAPTDAWEHSETPSLGLAPLPANPVTRADHTPADQQQFRPPAPVAERIGEDAETPVGEILPENWWSDEESASHQTVKPTETVPNSAPPPNSANPAAASIPPTLDFTDSVSAVAGPNADEASTPSPLAEPPMAAEQPEIRPSLSQQSAPSCEAPSCETAPTWPQQVDSFSDTAEMSSFPRVSAPLAEPAESPANAQADPVPQPVPSADNQLKQNAQAPAGQSATDPNQLITAFLAGLAVQPTTPLTDAQMLELMHQAGRLLRLVTQSTAEVLQARSALKSEFRLNQTILRPAENNPLKFSLNLDQTLRDLLLEHRPGYIDPESAFKEAMTDIKHHEIAVMAGMRAAFECLIDKFSPETVEQNLRARGKGAKRLPLTDKTWNYFVEYFRAFKANAGDEFDGIFGQDFVRAYEEQIEQLSRKQ